MDRTLTNSKPDQKFLLTLCAELLNTSAYVQNRTGKSLSRNISRYQLWTGKKQRINHLTVIGSVSYIHIPKQRRSKMDNKAVKAYFIGYEWRGNVCLWI